MGQTSCTTPIEVLLELEKAITQNIQITSGVFQNSRVEILPTRTEGNIDTIFGKYSYPKTKNFYLSPFDFFAIDVSFTITQCLTKGASFVLSPSVDCANGGTVEDACTLLLQRLTTEQKNDCILPSYDFSNPVVQDATTPTQQADLSNWLCPPVTPNVPGSFLLDGFNESFSTRSTVLNNWNGKTPLTITCWVKATDFAKTQGLVSKIGTGIGFGWYFILIPTGFGLLKAGTFSDLTSRVTTVATTNNTWNHFAVVDDGSNIASNIKLYKNGVELAATSQFSSFGSTCANGNPLSIGQRLAGDFFGGNFCYTRMWNKAFTPADITADFNGGLLLDVPLYPLDLAAGFTPDETAIYANPIWNARNEADATNGFGSSNNLEYSDLTTDIPT